MPDGYYDNAGRYHEFDGSPRGQVIPDYGYNTDPRPPSPKQIPAPLPPNLPEPLPEASVFTFQRCGNKDRDDAMTYVNESYADGHLDDEEYEVRAAYIRAAKTHEQLVQITGDLGLSLDKWLKNRAEAQAQRVYAEQQRRKAAEKIPPEPAPEPEPSSEGLWQLFVGGVIALYSALVGGLLHSWTAAVITAPLFAFGIILAVWGFRLGAGKNLRGM